MAGQPGFELFGPWEEGETVRQALIKAGQDFGMRLVGGRAYSTNMLESGWVPSPLPAVCSGEKMKVYREWLPTNGYEVTASLGGSLVPTISKTTTDAMRFGLRAFVKFDHDFIGREARKNSQAAASAKGDFGAR